MARVPLVFTVNGAEQAEFVEPGAMLIEVLRDKLGLTAAKFGCGQGTCGACMVIVDGAPMLSCLIPAQRAAGRAVDTLEVLARGAELHPLQRAFAAGFAAQCGFCTSGMLLTAYELILGGEPLSRTQIREALSGNLCRCTGYHAIVDAVEAVSVRTAVSDTGGHP